MTRTLLAAAVFALTATTAAQADPVAYEFDKTHTLIRASWNHQDYSTQELHFTDYDGSLALDLDTPSDSTVDITFNLIDGIWPGAHHQRFINHLNSADFFETEVNPTARFVGTGFETEDGQIGTMTGDLTMNGQTHPVTLSVVLNRSDETQDGRSKLGFTATGTLMRSEWDMGFATPFVSDEIDIFISTELVEIVEDNGEEEAGQ
ncbi:YceI family protein [Maricaulis sp. CAU 1757]